MSLRPPTSLFSSGPRVDDGPAPYSRAAYAALDLSPRASAAEVRRLLDEWYRRLPPVAAGQIHERFRSSEDITHLGALLELYVYELASQFSTEVDIDVGRDDGEGRRPDLLVACGEASVYIEATAVTGGDVHDQATSRNLDEIYDAVNAVIAPAFDVEVSVERIGSSTPSKKHITRRLQGFLDRLDPDALLAAAERRVPPEHIKVRTGEWRIGLTARPLALEHRNYPNHRVVGSRFDGLGSIDDRTPLRRKLKSKATHYGQLDRPYVVAVLCAGPFVTDDDIFGALFGPTR